MSVSGSACPQGLYLQRPRNGTQAVPYGFAGGSYRSTARVVFATLLGDESSPLHGVVPFVRTSSIRGAPGTAHRPFPTVSLVGEFFHPHRLYSKRGLAMNHRRYIAWFHSSTQVVFGTWPLAFVSGLYYNFYQRERIYGRRLFH